MAKTARPTFSTSLLNQNNGIHPCFSLTYERYHMQKPFYTLDFGLDFDPKLMLTMLDSPLLDTFCVSDPSKFKQGDKVTLHDYSYSLGFINGALVREAAGKTLGYQRPDNYKEVCEVVASGLRKMCLPTDNSYNPRNTPLERNDVILLHRPSGTLIFTQERFLRSAAPPPKCDCCGMSSADPAPKFVVNEGVSVQVYSFQGVLAFNRHTGKRFVTVGDYILRRGIDKATKQYTVLATDCVLPDRDGGRSNNTILFDRGNGDTLYIQRCYLLQPKCPKCGHLM